MVTQKNKRDDSNDRDDADNHQSKRQATGKGTHTCQMCSISDIQYSLLLLLI